MDGRSLGWEVPSYPKGSVRRVPSDRRAVWWKVAARLCGGYGASFHSDEMHDKDGGDDAAEKRFRDSMSAFATSHVMGTIDYGNPEERASRKQASSRRCCSRA